jgi:xylulokinase
MSPRHMLRHFARAVLEGVAFSVRRVLDQVEQAGVTINEVRVSGGGAKSDFWTQIRADVTGKRMVKLKELESGCLGAAMLAGVGTRVYADVVEATREAVKTSKVFVPDDARHELYTKRYREFVGQTEKLC